MDGELAKATLPGSTDTQARYWWIYRAQQVVEAVAGDDPNGYRVWAAYSDDLYRWTKLTTDLFVRPSPTRVTDIFGIGAAIVDHLGRWHIYLTNGTDSLAAATSSRRFTSSDGTWSAVPVTLQESVPPRTDKPT